MTYWAFGFPVDVIKSKMQADDVKNRRYRTFWGCAAATFKESGMLGFYRGLAPCLLRAFPVNAASFMAFEFGRKWLASF